MKYDLSASDQLRRIYPEEGMAPEFSREVTFQLTERCSLQCTYCYQINKSPKVMSWDVAKNIVDLLFKMYDDNIEGAFITKNTKMIILDFIGGEPLLEVELMDKICDYFWKTAIKKRHVWSRTFMISIATNGVAHFEPKVQEFLYKYRYHLSYSVSIDGPKEMHDACRVFPDGSGSFDLAKAAQDDFNEHFYNSIGTKATLARANLPMLSTLIKYYVGQGFEQIHANYVYEEEWNEEDAKLLYNQLKETADYILSLDKEVELALFEENFFKPKDEEDNQNWCGGTGAMLAFNPDGIAYPCIRYMESSVGDDVEPLVIGDTKGLYNTDKFIEIRDFLDGITRRSQSTDECWYCPIGEGCSWCSAWNYQYMGSPNRRCTNICIMHKARSLANIYFWNKKYQKEGQKKTFKRWLTDDEALKIVSKDELDMLDSLINKDYEIVNSINFNYNYDDYIKSIGQNNEAKNKYAKKQQ